MTVIADNVAKGDSGPVWMLDHIDANGNQLSLASGYTCKMAVEGTLISRTITDRSEDNLYYLISLTAAETATLIQGLTYTVGLQLENATYIPALVKEVRQRIFIDSNIVP